MLSKLLFRKHKGGHANLVLCEEVLTILPLCLVHPMVHLGAIDINKHRFDICSEISDHFFEILICFEQFTSFEVEHSWFHLGRDSQDI